MRRHLLFRLVCVTQALRQSRWGSSAVALPASFCYHPGIASVLAEPMIGFFPRDAQPAYSKLAVEYEAAALLAGHAGAVPPQ